MGVKARRRALEYAVLLGGTALAGTLLGFCGRAAWIADLFAHFRVQYVVLLAVAAGLAAIASWRLLAAVFVAAMLINVALIAPFWLSRGVEPAPPRLRIGYLNVLTSNRDKAAVSRWIDTSGADVVLAVEIDEGWHQSLVKASSYDLALSQPRSDNFGMALLVRRGGAATVTSAGLAAVFDTLFDVPVIEARVGFGDCELRLLGLHTLPPTGPRYAAARDGQLAMAATWARGGGPALVLGDLNATRWSHPFRALLRDGELVDSARGFGLHPTWPAFPGPIAVFRIPIDQAVHSESLVTTRRELGPFVGSDHFPLLLELAWRAGEPCEALPDNEQRR